MRQQIQVGNHIVLYSHKKYCNIIVFLLGVKKKTLKELNWKVKCMI